MFKILGSFEKTMKFAELANEEIKRLKNNGLDVEKGMEKFIEENLTPFEIEFFKSLGKNEKLINRI